MGAAGTAGPAACRAAVPGGPAASCPRPRPSMARGGRPRWVPHRPTRSRCPATSLRPVGAAGPQGRRCTPPPSRRAPRRPPGPRLAQRPSALAAQARCTGLPGPAARPWSATGPVSRTPSAPSRRWERSSSASAASGCRPALPGPGTPRARPHQGAGLRRAAGRGSGPAAGRRADRGRHPTPPRRFRATRPKVLAPRLLPHGRAAPKRPGAPRAEHRLQHRRGPARSRRSSFPAPRRRTRRRRSAPEAAPPKCRRLLGPGVHPTDTGGRGEDTGPGIAEGLAEGCPTAGGVPCRLRQAAGGDASGQGRRPARRGGRRAAGILRSRASPNRPDGPGAAPSCSRADARFGVPGPGAACLDRPKVQAAGFSACRMAALHRGPARASQPNGLKAITDRASAAACRRRPPRAASCAATASGRCPSALATSPRMPGAATLSARRLPAPAGVGRCPWKRRRRGGVRRMAAAGPFAAVRPQVGSAAAGVSTERRSAGGRGEPSSSVQDRI